MYYLQSRYYDPAIGRFINADTFATTDADGFLSCNMFAYCENNPVNKSDYLGHASSPTIDLNLNGIPDYLDERYVALTEKWKRILNPGSGTRNVTNEVDKALKPYIELGKWFRGNYSPYEKYAIFYNLVNHSCPWDIKQQQKWESTIRTPFPGDGAIVVYRDKYVTPEHLGNYTYGFLGNAFGIRLDVLYLGSYYAAGFPLDKSGLENELIEDWYYIKLGYWDYLGYR